MFFKQKKPIPDSLNICLVGTRFQILSRSSDHGFLWPIARGLAKRGHKVTVLSTTSPLGKSEVFRDGVKAYYLLEGEKKNSRKRFEDVAFQKFNQLHRDNPFDIVHSLDRSGYKIAARKKDHKVAVAYDIQATQMSQLFSILGMGQESLSSLLSTAAAVTYKFLTTYYGGDKKILSTADGIFVTSPQQRILLERYYLYPDFHIYQVPYGVELHDLTPKEQTEEIRKKYNLPAHSHIVMTLSDMTELREVIYLLQAFEKLAIKKPNAYLIIVGSGPLWKEIEYQILMLALGKKVIMTGPATSNEVADYISMSDIFVNMSTRSTGFEPSLIEAMAQKKLVIGSEVSPMSHIVEDGLDGFLLRPADIESLGQLMIEVFSGNIPAEQIGERARNKVLDLFNTQKMLNSVISAYQNILINSDQYQRVSTSHQKPHSGPTAATNAP